jgi:DNA-binding MarR family transcriptional regulator
VVSVAVQLGLDGSETAHELVVRSRAHGLTERQVALVSALRRARRPSGALELAAIAGYQASGAWGALQRLEARGLAQRYRLPHGRRTLWLDVESAERW